MSLQSDSILERDEPWSLLSICNNKSQIHFNIYLKDKFKHLKYETDTL